MQATCIQRKGGKLRETGPFLTEEQNHFFAGAAARRHAGGRLSSCKGDSKSSKQETKERSEAWKGEFKAQCGGAGEASHGDKQWELRNYKKIAYTAGKAWMEARLAKGASNMTLEEAKQIAGEWIEQIDVTTFDS